MRKMVSFRLLQLPLYFVDEHLLDPSVTVHASVQLVSGKWKSKIEE